MATERKRVSILRRTVHGVCVLVAAVVLTLAFFLVLPLMQTITKPPEADLMVQSVDTASLEPPPTVEEPEPEEEPEQEEIEPELVEDTAPLDLAQLELALNPGYSDSWLGGDFAVKLPGFEGEGGGANDSLFAIHDLDQKPRVLYQPSPNLDRKVREAGRGTVHVIFIVDKRGRVQDPQVQRTDNSVFSAAALAAVKRWKFEPGKRGGEPVRFRMRVPITFGKG